MELEKLIARAKAILLAPKTEWPIIGGESTSAAGLFKGYVVWLAAIAAIAGFIASTFVGYSVPFLGTYRVGFGSGLARALTQYVLSLAGVVLIALLVDALAPTFKGEKNFTQALKVVAYAYTASWIAGIGAVIPGLRWLIALAGLLYSIYLLYLGLPYTMKCPPGEAVKYTAVTLVAAIALSWVISIAATRFISPGFVPGAYEQTSASTGHFDASSPGGKLERWAQGVEAASQKVQAAQQRGDSPAAASATGAVLGAVLGGGNVTVQALAPERIREFLPASLGSLARREISAERNTALGLQVSHAEAQYGDTKGHDITLKIADAGGARGLVSLASWANVEEEKQTSTSYEKTYKSGDRMVHEQWNTPTGQDGMGYGEYAIILGQRYSVEASGRVGRIDELKSAVGSVDLARLESLKNEGVHAN
ncbi:MAG: Yip1 family protein [Steroidobacteraceae bacterium]